VIPIVPQKSESLLADRLESVNRRDGENEDGLLPEEEVAESEERREVLGEDGSGEERGVVLVEELGEEEDGRPGELGMRVFGGDVDAVSMDKEEEGLEEFGGFLDLEEWEPVL